MDQIERFRGCLLGLAAGDAVGTTPEFKPPGFFEPLNDMVGGGPFGLKAGQWTDDTSMALCLAESLIKKKVFVPYDQMVRYCRWWRKGHLSRAGRCFDIGRTVRMALSDFERSQEPYCGPVERRFSGNGSIMRLAPVPLFYSQNPVGANERSGESSRTTHGSSICVDACRYLGALLVGAVNGAGKEELLEERFSPVIGYWDSWPLIPEIDEIAAGSFKRRQPPEIKGTGYAAASLEASLWAFYHADSFKEGCLMAVNLGDDADTTGAVYGQLAGAFYGERAIPELWRERLAHHEMIESFAEQLYAFSRGR
ncbi:MAG: ADP-ribosylglycohydrolase family protein [Candidatus Abyssubacteria bacterium]